MKIDKEFILRNLLTICCVAVLVFMLLPFANVKVEMQSDFINTDTSTSIIGYATIFGSSASFFGWIMLLCPVVLIAMNYIKQLDKYKSLLAIILPVVSIIAGIILMFTGGASSEASAMGEAASAKTKLTPNIGFFLLLIAFVGMLVAGAVTYYGLKLTKDGLTEFGDKLKENGLSAIDSLKEKGSGIVSGASGASSAGAASDTDATPAAKAKPGVNVNQANDVLELIANLSKMKESGVLTEEEFNAKKKELLEQI